MESVRNLFPRNWTKT